MQRIYNEKVKENLYIEKLENGLKVMIIPKPGILKKYIIIGPHFGSIDNHFIMPENNEEIQLPDGVAHFLEHKMFEQSNGTNSLDVLSSLGVEANAYTTNDHTAYLFEATDNFYEAMDELMNYVQNPYFTDENVEKEKGIIGQEINMYEDDPAWQSYINSMKLMYKNNPIKIDIAGSIKSISNITKETLYNAYNTFYNPSNMTLVVCGDFVPEEILKEIKNRITKHGNPKEIKRIYEEEPDQVVKKEQEVTMDVTNPIFAIGFKDKVETNEIVKKHIAIEIILYMLLGKSSKLYQELYKEGNLMGQPDLDYEFSTEYAHVLITGMSQDPKKLANRLEEEIKRLQETGLDKSHFERVKKKIYGDYVTEYNDVSNIARMFLADSFKGINSFEYLDKYESVTVEYANSVLKDTFNLDNMVISIVKGK